MDQITQFELLLMELNRNIAYDEKDKVTVNYNKLNDLYKGILKSDVSMEEKNRLYNHILTTHDGIQTMGQRKLSVPKMAAFSFAGLAAAFFLFKGPEMTGMAILDGNNILTPIARFAPAAILGVVVLFTFLNKNKKK